MMPWYYRIWFAICKTIFKDNSKKMHLPEKPIKFKNFDEDEMSEWHKNIIDIVGIGGEE
jgi:hypothetical protein